MEAMTGQTDSTRGRSHLRVVGDPPATQAHDPIGLEHGTRRVIICASVALFLVLGAFVIISGRGGLSDAAGVGTGGASAGSSESSSITVRKGDTVWEVARRLEPEGDVRPLVDRITEANGGADLVPGQVLRVPSG